MYGRPFGVSIRVVDAYTVRLLNSQTSPNPILTDSMQGGDMTEKLIGVAVAGAKVQEVLAEIDRVEELGNSRRVDDHRGDQIGQPDRSGRGGVQAGQSVVRHVHRAHLSHGILW